MGAQLNLRKEERMTDEEEEISFGFSSPRTGCRVGDLVYWTDGDEKERTGVVLHTSQTEYGEFVACIQLRHEGTEVYVPEGLLQVRS